MDGSELETIGIVAHPRRDCRLVFSAVDEWAARERIEILTLAEESPFSTLGAAVAEEELAARAGLVIAAGGDGTILRALAIAAPVGVPVLGVDVGRLGFLAEVEPPELPGALASIAAGEFDVEQRLALAGEARSAAGCARMRASNDLVLGRVPGRGQAELAASVDGELFTRYVGDGLIVSTPTGSTAYSLSAGGPIVAPTTQAILLTALAPHGVFDRSLVLAPSETLQIDVLDRSAPVVIERDGAHDSDLAPGDRLTVTASAEPGLLIRLGGSNFYRRARHKLQLVDPLVLAADAPATTPNPRNDR
jgi:NAD+ kinase